MNFLPDVVRALRNLPRQALQPRNPGGALQGKTIADVLEMPVEEAAVRVHSDCRHLNTLVDVGLVHSPRTARSHTLSGGEAQHVSQPNCRSAPAAIYVLDEPFRPAL